MYKLQLQLTNIRVHQADLQITIGHVVWHDGGKLGRHKVRNVVVNPPATCRREHTAHPKSQSAVPLWCAALHPALVDIEAGSGATSIVRFALLIHGQCEKVEHCEDKWKWKVMLMFVHLLHPSDGLLYYVFEQGLLAWGVVGAIKTLYKYSCPSRSLVWWVNHIRYCWHTWIFKTKRTIHITYYINM
jgi:hypothetical protein